MENTNQHTKKSLEITFDIIRRKSWNISLEIKEFALKFDNDRAAENSSSFYNLEKKNRSASPFSWQILLSLYFLVIYFTISKNWKEQRQQFMNERSYLFQKKYSCNR